MQLGLPFVTISFLKDMDEILLGDLIVIFFFFFFFFLLALLLWFIFILILNLDDPWERLVISRMTRV
jgi:hypothetical protein